MTSVDTIHAAPEKESTPETRADPIGSFQQGINHVVDMNYVWFING